jgi:predicted dehydrogenase
MKKITRRRFLHRAAISSAALPVVSASLSVAPGARVLGANDDIRLGVVGLGSTVKIGGQGKRDLRTFRQIPGVRVVALCDADRAHLDAELEQFRKWGEKPDAYVDVRKLLESKEIDAVSVTTPNHWHALATIWACQAGKDVFVQKPASHNIFEGRKMVEAARRHNRIVQCPSGSRSRTGILEALQYARQGKLGKIRYVHGVNYRPRMSIGKVGGPQPIPATLDYDLWSGPAPIMPLMREYLHYDWHWDWLYGNGDLGNMGIHYVDGCRMAVGQDRLPPRVMSIGGRFGFADDGHTPNSLVVFLDYEPAPILFEVRGLPKNRALQRAPWEKGGAKVMDAYCGIAIGLVIHCENGYVANNKAFDRDGKLIEEFQPANPDLYANFIECVRSRRAGDLRADILQGHLSAALVHMGNISYRIGKAASAGEIKERIRGRKELLGAYERLQAHLSANGVDLEKTPAMLGPMLTMEADAERFVGQFSEESNRLATRQYRAPFVVPAAL